MEENATRPFTLEVLPSEKPAGHFHWVIRKNGKLAERSDRSYPSEKAARERGEAALERAVRAERE
jgi:hypothetical protein